MAYSSLYFYSEVLTASQKVNVLLPEPANLKNQEEEMSVLYLLHGMTGSAGDWMVKASTERFMRDSGKNIMIVLPTMQSNFYTDQKLGWNYFTYVSEELPRIIESYFNITPKRENTFVAGLSMGGYGALKMALTYPERFAYAASFSGGVDIVSILKSGDVNGENATIFKAMFGSAEETEGTSNDLYYLLENCVESKKQLPKLYVSCGTADFLWETNERFAAHAEQLGCDITFYKEDQMGHAWRFWDGEVEKLLRTLL